MPKHLLAACILYIVYLGGMSLLAPLHETGIAKFTSPILMCLFIFVVVSFMRRRVWTWKIVHSFAMVEVVFGALVLAMVDFDGAYADLERVLRTMNVGVCAVIVWSLSRHPETKAWFVQS